MITVHHLNNSRSQRVLWLLEELGLEYEIKKYQRDPRTMLAPPDLRAIHPLGNSPVITDGATTVAESGRGGLDQQYPTLAAFLERIHARPAYQRALERGGRYELIK